MSEFNTATLTTAMKSRDDTQNPQLVCNGFIVLGGFFRVISCLFAHRARYKIATTHMLGQPCCVAAGLFRVMGCLFAGSARCKIAPHTKKPVALLQRVSLIRSLAMSYFHMANATLSSALFRFTTEFGMGSGGSKTLLSPSIFCLLIALAIN